MQSCFHFTAGFAIFCALVVTPAYVVAGVKYSDGDKYVKIGSHMQLQYHQENPDNGPTTDEIFFRRLKFSIEGSTYRDWLGKIQVDLGKAKEDNEVDIKEAFFQYHGMKNIKLRIGNDNFPFSREVLTSSKRQQLVERTFVGDHNYGTPDKNLGIHLTGNNGSKKITWGASAAFATIDPDVNKLDFDTPANRNEDFNEGLMIGGRIDYHPFGYLKFSQGDFSGDTRATIGIAAYSWNNDGDNNSYTPPDGDPDLLKADVDSVNGFEISAALRAVGFSIDAEYNTFDADTVEPGLTGGIYSNGSTTLSNAAIEGGYMFDKTIELVAGYQTQDADGYATAWNRTSVGLNWFINRHNLKFQFTYRIGENLDGLQNNNSDEMFLQGQFVF